MGFIEAEKIEWIHVYPDGSRMPNRTGVIWSEAQPCEGTSSAWWVIPDTHYSDDIYHALLVGRNSRPVHSVHGMFSNALERVLLPRGALFASNYPSSPTGQAAAYAMRHAAAIRAAQSQ